MVYARQTAGQTYTFQVSGTLWRNGLVMQDRETGTLWSHVTGEAIHGPGKGRSLETLPAAHTTWARWKARHPDTEVLLKDRAFRESGYEDYFEDENRTGLFRANWLTGKMPGKERVIGVRRGVHALAVKESRLGEPGAFVSGMLGDESIVVARGPDGAARAFVLGSGETRVELLRSKDGTVRDADSRSRWDLTTGRAVEGGRAGEKLEELPVTTAFWFAWSSFFPNTAVVD